MANNVRVGSGFGSVIYPTEPRIRNTGFSRGMKLRCILEQGALHHQDQHQGGQHSSPLPQIEPVLGALCRLAVK
jgi:hypothetical protein